MLKRYNNADKYAIAVGLLADEIGGYGGLVNDWNRPFTRLSFEEKQELQQRLSEHGYYDGKLDGKIGEGSRSAIKAFRPGSALRRMAIRARKCFCRCVNARHPDRHRR